MQLRASTLCLALLGTVLAGCGRRPSPGSQASGPLLVYCTSAVEAQAKALKPLLEETMGRPVVVAPLAGADLVAALEGLKAGDLAVIPGSRLRDRLVELKLVRGEPVSQPLAVCAVSAKPLDLADLAKPGSRLGGGAKDSERAAAVERVLPADLRPLVEANLRQRSERGEELVRLVRLGALDAAFVWATPPPPADLHLVRLPDDPTPCPLLVVALSCSRLSAADSAALLAAVTGEGAARALRGENGGKGARRP